MEGFLSWASRDGAVVHVITEVVGVSDIQGVEDVVHHSLKGGRGVSEAEEHDSWFEETPRCLKGGLPLVALFDADVVIPPADVELAKKSLALHAFNAGGDAGEWGGIGDSVFVDRSVVLYGAPLACLLLNVKDWYTVGGVGLYNVPFLQVLVEEFVLGLFLTLQEGVDLAVDDIRGVW